MRSSNIRATGEVMQLMVIFVEITCNGWGDIECCGKHLMFDDSECRKCTYALCRYIYLYMSMYSLLLNLLLLMYFVLFSFISIYLLEQHCCSIRNIAV